MGSGMSSPLSSCCLASPGLSASGPRVRQPSAAEKGKECGWVGRATRQVQLYSPHLMTHTGGLALASQWIADLSPHGWIWKTVNNTQLLAGIFLTRLTELTVAT